MYTTVQMNQSTAASLLSLQPWCLTGGISITLLIVCMCTQAEAGGLLQPVQLILPRYGVQCHSWVGRAYSEKSSQTYGNMALGETAKVNPCQTHQPTLACPVCI